MAYYPKHAVSIVYCPYSGQFGVNGMIRLKDLVELPLVNLVLNFCYQGFGFG
jgi:hypothetical protein